MSTSFQLVDILENNIIVSLQAVLEINKRVIKTPFVLPEKKINRWCDYIQKLYPC